MPEDVYVEETRRKMRSKKRSSSKDPNRGERRWHKTLEKMRKEYGDNPEQPEESESEGT